MKTIVMPLDFSPASLNAVNYAMDLAEKINASVTLVYVCQYPVSINEVPMSAQVYTSILEDAHARIRELKNDLQRTTGDRVKIYTEVMEGTVVTQVEDLCNTLKPFAVVIGAQGTSAVERFVFGSTAISAIRHLSWPLIIVPAGAKFKGICSIGLACDLKKVIGTVHAREIKKLVTEFHADLHILHINTDPEKMISDEEIEGSEYLREMLIDIKPEFHFINKENADEAIREFSEKNNLDLLVVIPKNHGLLDRLVHKSHAKQVVLASHIPVMSIHE